MAMAGGYLIAAGPVMVMAASFSNIAYERLPLDQDQQDLQAEHMMQQSGGRGHHQGLPFLNLPLNNSDQAMDGWPTGH